MAGAEGAGADPAEIRRTVADSIREALSDPNIRREVVDAQAEVHAEEQS
ncbi:MAG: hypothetical protein GY722_22665 [bacterium]|nr:hypothetical protein [bacterium]